MARATILLLFACGGIVIQASPWDANANPNVNILSPRRNINANTNMNIIGRRNINANANTNIIGRRDISANTNTNIIGRRNINANSNANIMDAVPITRYDEVDNVADAAMEKIRRKVYHENDPSIASAAVAAGDAAFSVIREFAGEMSETASQAVVDAVVNILRRRNTSPYNRRQLNANSNTNIIGGGGSGVGGGGSYGGGGYGGSGYGGGGFAGDALGGSTFAVGPTYHAQHVYGGDLTLAQGGGGHALGLGSGPGGFAHAHGGRYADADADADEEGEEVEDVEDTTKDVKNLEEDLEDKEIAATKSLGGRYYPRRTWGWGFLPSQGSANANTNTNLMGYPRKMRRNINANTNVNVIGHRRAQG